MVTIKNIKKTPDGISGDAYVEDCPAPVRVFIDSAGEAHSDPLPEGYEVASDPGEYDMNEGIIIARVLPVSLAWIGKREGCNPELELFLTLA